MLHILLVEDYMSFADAASDALKARGHAVSHVATNLHAALGALDETKYGQWDAVITDFDLGNGSGGPEVARAALDAGVPLVVLWSAIPRDRDPGVAALGGPNFLLLGKDDVDAVAEALDGLQ
jgi:DNA-binding response OmpR family regulator